jgi:hypothetical protein
MPPTAPQRSIWLFSRVISPSSLDLSVIFINWRLKRDVETVLAGVAEHKHRCTAEIILVNKPSGDGTEELIAGHHPHVRLFSHPEFGFATMRNVGLREARGRYCLILDTDIELRPGCFDELVAFMDAHPEVGGCGGHTTRLDGNIEYNVKRFYDLATVVVRRSPLERLWPENPWNKNHLMMDKDHSKPFYGDWMAGACFCIRKAAVADAGYFDESMHYFEDVDWCWRAKFAGWKIAFCPKGGITHNVQGLSKKGWNRNTFIHLLSGIRFWWKTTDMGLTIHTEPRRAPLVHDTPELPREVDLSVVIVNYRARQLLLDCLESLAAAAPRHRLQLIVVDNASDDGSVQAVRRHYPGVTVIANRDNLGFTKANNQGIALATGRHVMLLNNDTRVHAGAFSEAIEFLDGEPAIGVVGLKLLNDDGSLQLSCRRFPSFHQALFNRYSLLTKLFPNNYFSRQYLMTDIHHDKVQDVDWVSGACLGIRRAVLDQVGTLDERFFMYSEDVDYCFRVWQAGWRVSYLPTAQVVHLIGQSTKRVRYRTTWERHRSMYRFYRKHYSQSLMLVDLLTAAMVGLRCGAQIAATWLQQVLTIGGRSAWK